MQGPRPSPRALIPFLFFFLFYVLAGLWFTLEGREYAFYQYPAPSCALLGFAVALLLGRKNLSHYVNVFTAGVGEQTVVLMCLIFMMAGAFSSLTKAMGAVDATVNLGLSFLHPSLLTPGIFLISCAIAVAIGTSMGTIGAMIPIAMGVAETSGLSPAMTAGAVLSGAMFGDNISIISDTTIAATGTQNCDMRSKMLANLKVAIPAAAVACTLYGVMSPTAHVTGASEFLIVKTVPYWLVLCFALFGMNVIAVLMLGIVSAIFIGVATDAFAIAATGKLIYQGFEDMSEVFYMTVLIAGLASIAAKEGGLEWIIVNIQRVVRGRKSAELAIAAIVSLVDICVANNTVAIVISGPMAKDLSTRYGISPARTASLLDIFSCIWQGVIPYGAQLLLVMALARLSPFEIIPYSWYPVALAGGALVSIATSTKAFER